VVGGFELDVAQPASDDVELNAGLQQVNGCGVPEHMGRDAPGLLTGPIEGSPVPTDELVDAEPSEWLPWARAEHVT